MSLILCMDVNMFVCSLRRQRDKGTLLSMAGDGGIVKLAKDEFHTVE